MALAMVSGLLGVAFLGLVVAFKVISDHDMVLKGIERDLLDESARRKRGEREQE